MNLLQLLRVLGLNAVPVGGVMVAGWSTATGLTLYWCETVLGTATNAVRIALHRRWTGKRGHFHGQLGVVMGGGESVPGKRQKVTKWRSFLSEYLVGSLGFSLGHAVFLAMILGALLKSWPAKSDLLYGLAGIAIFQVGGLALDLVTLADWPFARLKRQMQSAMGRVVLVHMAIVFGMMAFAWLNRPGSFFWVFGGLKTLSDVGSLVAGYRGAPAGRAASPAAAPKWAKKVVERLAPGEDVDVYWRRECEREAREAAADEEPVPTGRR